MTFMSQLDSKHLSSKCSMCCSHLDERSVWIKIFIESSSNKPRNVGLNREKIICPAGEVLKQRLQARNGQSAWNERLALRTLG